jgi:hypothetical protein
MLTPDLTLSFPRYNTNHQANVAIPNCCCDFILQPLFLNLVVEFFFVCVAGHAGRHVKVVVDILR